MPASAGAGPAPRRAPERYCVAGKPVEHSLSPRIHAAFARQLGESLSYTACPTEPGRLAAALEAFRAAGGRGMNVTVPLKQEAAAVADELSARARLAGAVNTLSFEAAGPVYGDNTDGVGLVRDLTVNHGLALAGRAVLVIGAGGAARGIVGALFEAGVERLVIANRTRARAERLAADLAACGPIIVNELDTAASDAFDLIINATAAGHGAGLALPPRRDGGAFCYDLSYGPAAEPFLRWARAAGAPASDGLGMLVEQAAESFQIWRGRRPQTAPVIAALGG